MPLNLVTQQTSKAAEEEDPLELNDQNKRHPLFENMENAKFLLMKAPNIETLNLAIQKSEWALTKQAGEKLREVYVQSSNVILFFSVNQSNTYQCAAKVTSGELRPVSQEWLQVW